MQYDCWQQALQEEHDALKEKHTWDIVPCPNFVKPIGCQWVYSIKLNPDGSLAHYKARLVALDNRQEYGIYYEETCSYSQDDIRSYGSCLVASQSWPLYQMDVKNAFLHGELKEEV